MLYERFIKLLELYKKINDHTADKDGEKLTLSYDETVLIIDFIYSILHLE